MKVEEVDRRAEKAIRQCLKDKFLSLSNCIDILPAPLARKHVNIISSEIDCLMAFEVR